jgi:hypothetical protein
MLRSIFAVIAAIVTWFLVATILNLILRVALPGYSQVEPAMTFSLTMMICRLALALVSSLCAGFICAAIVGPGNLAPWAAGAILVLMFLPVHYMLWAKFPVWYHLFFLITLAPMVALGATLKRKAG